MYKITFRKTWLIILFAQLFSIAHTNNIKQVSIIESGKVMCWGYNKSGQLGNGKDINNYKPTYVKTGMDNLKPITDVIQVVGGADHSCALLKSGKVKCWGSNEYGQLGMSMYSYSFLPVYVQKSSSNTAPLENVISISAGENYTCALMQDSTVNCWGNGSSGQLGNHSYDTQFYPSPVYSNEYTNSPLDGVSSISTGSYHACALLNNNTARCWGAGGSGALGDDTFMTRASPSYVHTSSYDDSPLDEISKISSAEGFSCALLKNGSAKCWGDMWGWIATDDPNGDNKRQATPTFIFDDKTKSSHLTNAIQISSNSHGTCVLLEDNSLKCWGDDRYWNLGLYRKPMPEYFKNNEGQIINNNYQFSLGASHTCLMLSDKKVSCYGNNYFNQVGLPGEYSKVAGNIIPLEVTPIKMINNSSGNNHTCIIVNK